MLTRDDEGDWRGHRLAPASGPDGDGDLPDADAKWTVVRDRWIRKLGMRYVVRIVLAKDELGDSRMLLLFAAHPDMKGRSDKPLTVEAHNKDVRAATEDRARDLRLDRTQTEALLFAAAHHDLGKGRACGDGCWQRAINGHRDEHTDLAKSIGKGMNSQLLAGYRHEFGSLVEAVKSEAFKALAEPARDLALHLIAAHHGRGRPHFTPEATKTPLDQLPAELHPAEVARRFNRLQRTYGHWGLAWLESILMSADAQASRDHDALRGEDEEEDEGEDGQ